MSASGSSKAFTYDANGSLTAEGSRTYEWDGANRLVRVLDNAAEVARFVYDGQSRRVQKISGGVSRTYIYDREDILEERPSSGATIRHVHGMGIDQPLASVESGIVAYLLSDHLGSALQATNASATVTLTRQYDLWGNLIQGSATAGYAYTGREWDSEIALYYYRARYYDPRIGRFVSEDPIGFGGGINFYEYVKNDPANQVDPEGLQGSGAQAYVCCRPLNSFFFGHFLGGRHCYIRMGDHTWGLYPFPGGLFGLPTKDDPRDFAGDCKPCTPKPGCRGGQSQAQCFDDAFQDYASPGVYGALAGPNSNTFAGTLATKCCQGAEPSGWAPNFFQSPPNPMRND